MRRLPVLIPHRPGRRVETRPLLEQSSGQRDAVCRLPESSVRIAIGVRRSPRPVCCGCIHERIPSRRVPKWFVATAFQSNAFQNKCVPGYEAPGGRQTHLRRYVLTQGAGASSRSTGRRSAPQHAGGPAQTQPPRSDGAGGSSCSNSAA